MQATKQAAAEVDLLLPPAAMRHLSLPEVVVVAEETAILPTEIRDQFPVPVEILLPAPGVPVVTEVEQAQVQQVEADSPVTVHWEVIHM